MIPHAISGKIGKDVLIVYLFSLYSPKAIQLRAMLSYAFIQKHFAEIFQNSASNLNGWEQRQLNVYISQSTHCSMQITY